MFKNKKQYVSILLCLFYTMASLVASSWSELEEKQATNVQLMNVFHVRYSKNGDNFIMDEIISDKDAVIIQLLNDSEIPLECFTFVNEKNGKTPLHAAIFTLRKNIVQLLLNKGIAVDLFLIDYSRIRYNFIEAQLKSKEITFAQFEEQRKVAQEIIDLLEASHKKSFTEKRAPLRRSLFN